jgi:hypothetical protein
MTLFSRARRDIAWLLMALISACDAEVGGGARDGGEICPSSQESGVWLLPFGPLTQEIHTQGAASVTVAVVRGSAKQGEGKLVSGESVRFRIVNLEGDGSLAAAEATTNAEGLARVTFKAGAKALSYQVEASLAGTCPPTFTIDVRQPVRQLRAVTPTPLDTLTLSRVPLTVEATTSGNAKLANEEITFQLVLGKTPETTLSSVNGSERADTLQIRTGAAGQATAMLATGSAPIPQLTVVASMAGTADAEVVIRIAQGADKPCQTSSDCPLSYLCQSGLCEAPPPPPPSTGCTADAQCVPPTICQTSTGICLEPTGKLCDPVEGLGCDPGDVCIGRRCARVPASCSNTSTCPATWACRNGTCVPGGQGPGGCTTNSTCPVGQACINGLCVLKASCAIAHAPDRMQGTWQFDSTVNLREALSPCLGGLLSAAGLLRNVLDARFSIQGVPSFVSKMVESYLHQLMDQYVPPWGQQLIIALGDLNDIVGQMRVLSTVQTVSTGNDSYVNSQQWDLVEFTYKGQVIAAPPYAIPGIGSVTIPDYPSYEACGVLFIYKHYVDKVIGGLIKWAIDTALLLVTCGVQDLPCFDSVEEALDETIDCFMLGVQMDQLIQSLWSEAPPVASIVAQACESEKQKLITLLSKELAALTTTLSLVELSGTVAIPNPPGDSVLQGGKWYGVLGAGAAMGNFEGTFSAKR